MIKNILISLLALAASVSLAAQPTARSVSNNPPPFSSVELTRQAQSVLEQSYEATGPGAVAIITRGGRTVFLGAHGLADVEARLPISTDTVFRLGSITKWIAAAALMKLVEEGRVDLDAPIVRYLPQYTGPGALVRVRHLLGHTSGIASYTSVPGVLETAAWAHTTEELRQTFEALALEFEPGERWQYSNSNYVLIGAIIESVTGDTWDAFVMQRIAAPLKLDTLRSGLEEASVAHVATGYAGIETVSPAKEMHMSFPHAAGALISNVSDLAMFARAFHHGGVVEAKSYDAMIRSGIRKDGTATGYGFGLFVANTIAGHTAIGHSGGIYGFATDSLYIPDEDLFVAVLANSEDPKTKPWSLSKRLAGLVLQAVPVLQNSDDEG